MSEGGERLGAFVWAAISRCWEYQERALGTLGRLPKAPPTSEGTVKLPEPMSFFSHNSCECGSVCLHQGKTSSKPLWGGKGGRRDGFMRKERLKEQCNAELGKDLRKTAWKCAGWKSSSREMSERAMQMIGGRTQSEEEERDEQVLPVCRGGGSCTPS